MILYTLSQALALAACFNVVHSDDALTFGLCTNFNHYCSTFVHSLKHLSLLKCAINSTFVVKEGCEYNVSYITGYTNLSMSMLQIFWFIVQYRTEIYILATVFDIDTLYIFLFSSSSEVVITMSHLQKHIQYLKTTSDILVSSLTKRHDWRMENFKKQELLNEVNKLEDSVDGLHRCILQIKCDVSIFWID